MQPYLLAYFPQVAPLNHHHVIPKMQVELSPGVEINPGEVGIRETHDAAAPEHHIEHGSGNRRPRVLQCIARLILSLVAKNLCQYRGTALFSLQGLSPSLAAAPSPCAHALPRKPGGFSGSASACEFSLGALPELRRPSARSPRGAWHPFSRLPSRLLYRPCKAGPLHGHARWRRRVADDWTRPGTLSQAP